MVDVSVIVCSHNPRPDYLRRVLEALRNQTLPKAQWELLLVDNASKEPLASTWDISWHPNALQIREDELGLAIARLRGMQESSADLLVFVDDDNVLDPSYFSEALRISRDWPLLGVWGSGCIDPEFELRPPEYLKDVCLGLLALRNIKTPCWSNVSSCSETVPWGAGICVRSNITLAYRRNYEESAIRIVGRRGTELTGYEDVEICYAACRLGFGMGIFPQLRLTHLIPKERVTEDFLLRMQEGLDTTYWLMRYKWHGDSPRSLYSASGLLSALKNILTTRGIHRRRQFARLRALIKARNIIAASRDDHGVERATRPVAHEPM
jgi:glycosyltransferase involved in cell wall biosynthesis